MNGHSDGIDTDLDRLCIIADSGSFLQPAPQEAPLVMLFEIPGVGSIWSPGGVLSDNARTALSALLWCASEGLVEHEEGCNV